MSAARSIVVGSRLPLVPGLRVSMRVQGEGDPLLLINGMTRPLESWDPFTRELHGRTVVSFDAPGVGRSPTPLRPVSIAELAALAVAVLDAAGLDDADVLGFSHGGAVAQQLARDVPDRVRRLILVSTSCGVGATPGNSRRAILHGLGKRDEDNPWPASQRVGTVLALAGDLELDEHPFPGRHQRSHTRRVRDPRPCRAPRKRPATGPTHP